MSALARENEHKLRAVHRALEWSAGFQLIVIRVTQGDVRSEVLRRLAAWSELKSGPPLIEIELSGSDSVVSRLEEAGRGREGLFGVVLTGLDASVAGDSRAPVIQQLNLHRDQLRSLVPGPLIIVANAGTTAALAEGAPDFYSWRALDIALEDDAELAGPLDLPTPSQAVRLSRQATAEVERLTKIIDEMREARGEPSPQDLAPILVRRGIAGIWEPDDRAKVDLQHALELYRSLADRKGEASALYALGLWSFRKAELQGARVFLEQSLELFEMIGDAGGAARSLEALGDVSLVARDHELAYKFYEQAARSYAARGDRHGAARAVKGRGSVLARMGRIAEARTNLEYAAKQHRELDDAQGEVEATLALARTFVDAGELERAIELYEHARAMSARSADAAREAFSLQMLGHIHLRRGELDKALSVFEKVLEISRVQQDQDIESIGLEGLGVAYFRLGDETRAFELYEAVLNLDGARRTGGDKARLALNAGNLALSSGKGETAERFYDLALSSALPEQRAAILLAAGHLEILRRDLPRARARFQSALDAAGDAGDRAQALSGLASAELLAHRHAAAADLFARAIAERPRGDDGSDAFDLLRLGELAWIESAIDYARRSFEAALRAAMLAGHNDPARWARIRLAALAQPESAARSDHLRMAQATESDIAEVERWVEAERAAAKLT